jgi:hypothetical protein
MKSVGKRRDSQKAALVVWSTFPPP